MSRPPYVPEMLSGRPFSRAEALKAGVTARQLQGSHFIRLFPRVWVHRDHPMTGVDWLAAAALAMPDRAQLSHISRIQAAGLDFGSPRPFHFTVVGDLHLDLAGIFLHRTEIMPPLDDVGVTPAAAFISLAATERLIDLIKIGDWLLRARAMTVLEVAELARRDAWRPGAHQVRRVLPHLDAASRSVKESESRAVLIFAGLPKPEVNVDLAVDGQWLGCVDLLYRMWLLVLEYEGRQHAGTIAQFNADISRYAGFRDNRVEYVQITNEMLRSPRRLVLRVHSRLVDRGYRGPSPVFGRRWQALFEPVRLAAVPTWRAVG